MKITVQDIKDFLEECGYEWDGKFECQISHPHIPLKEEFVEWLDLDKSALKHAHEFKLIRKLDKHWFNTGVNINLHDFQLVTSYIVDEIIEDLSERWRVFLFMRYGKKYFDYLENTYIPLLKSRAYKELRESKKSSFCRKNHREVAGEVLIKAFEIEQFLNVHKYDLKNKQGSDDFVKQQ